MDSGIDLPPLNLPALLRSYGLTTRKGLGQNFLIDDQILHNIVTAAEVNSKDVVLEIGAGPGNLTRWLALYAKKVMAVEMDHAIIPLLREVVGQKSNIQIIAGDILQINPQTLVGEDKYIVVANIPYYITSALFRHLLEGPVKPEKMVLTIQREVAARICASDGDLSLLALSVQVYGSPQLLMEIPAHAFYPIPKVDSALLKVDLYPQPLIPMENLNAFFKLCKAGFSQKRKMLHNSLSSGLGWGQEKTAKLVREAGIDPQRRAQTLTMDEWQLLTEKYLTQQ